MSAQRAGPGDATPESASENDVGATQNTSLLGDLLKTAEEMGHSVGEAKSAMTYAGATDAATRPYVIGDAKVEAAEAAKPDDETETRQTEEEETEEAQVEGEDQTETEKSETETAEAGEAAGDEPPKGLSVDDTIKWYKDHDKKVPWFYGRISEETRKKNDRTKERNAALEEITRLREENQRLQLQAENAPKPAAGANVLDGAWTEQQFNDLESECNRVILWAEENPDGGEYVVGKEKDGSDVTQELSRKQTIALKLAADKTLRDMPERKRQIAKIRDDRKAGDAEAIKAYPDLSNLDTDLGKFAAETLRDIPALNAVPDIGTWLGDAMRGRAMRLAAKNGKVGTGAKIAKSVQETRTVAPTVPKSRGFIPRGVKSADIEKAGKKLEERGDKESAEDFVAAALSHRRGATSKVEAVE